MSRHATPAKAMPQNARSRSCSSQRPNAKPEASGPSHGIVGYTASTGLARPGHDEHAEERSVWDPPSCDAEGVSQCVTRTQTPDIKTSAGGRKPDEHATIRKRGTEPVEHPENHGDVGRHARNAQPRALPHRACGAKCCGRVFEELAQHDQRQASECEVSSDAERAPAGAGARRRK